MTGETRDMFSDLVGSTALSDRMDPEDLRVGCVVDLVLTKRGLGSEAKANSHSARSTIAAPTRPGSCHVWPVRITLALEW